MERNFKACLCTYPKGKPIVHNENAKESQVSFGLMFNFSFGKLFLLHQMNFFELSMTAKSKGSLVYCFPREQSGVQELEVSLNSREWG